MSFLEKQGLDFVLDAAAAGVVSGVVLPQAAWLIPGYTPPSILSKQTLIMGAGVAGIAGIGAWAVDSMRKAGWITI